MADAPRPVPPCAPAPAGRARPATPCQVPTEYSYEVEPRPLHLGGGWRLRLLADGEEVGGGVFPWPDGPDAELAGQSAFIEALDEGSAWLASRDCPDHPCPSETGHE